MGQAEQDREVNRMKYRIGEKGFVKGLFIVLIIVACAFVAISFGKPHYRYLMLGSHTRDILKSELGNVETIKKQTLENAKELGIPLDEKNLEVFLDKKIIRVKATWSETVDFWGYYQKKFDFAMNEEY
jgi:hypothetical protein